MKYQLIDKNEQHLEKIVKAVKKSDAVYLATDPDREGEAISWHVLQALKEDHGISDIAVDRVVFNEITQKAIQEAFEEDREEGCRLLDELREEIAARVAIPEEAPTSGASPD